MAGSWHRLFTPPINPIDEWPRIRQQLACTGARPPSRRWVLTHSPVDGLAEQVRVPGVAAILLDQIAQQPAQARMLTLGCGDVDELVESAASQRRVDPDTRPPDRVVPEGVQLLRRIVGG